MTDRICDVPACSNKHRARGLCSTHYNQSVLGEGRRHPKAAVHCVVCQTLVVRRTNTPYSPTCSVRCRTVVTFGPSIAPTSSYSWSLDAIKRAMSFGALIVDRFDRIEIFERDDWTCQLCRIRCSSPDPYQLTAATIDHIVPLSAGGEHSRANTQTACLSCNSAKSDLLQAA